MDPQNFDMAKSMQLLLNLSANDEQSKEKARELNLDPEQLTNGMLLSITLLEAAKSGNMTAIREIRSLLDEGSAEGREVVIVDDISAQ